MVVVLILVSTVLTVLKLSGIINLSWWLVWGPVWFPIFAFAFMYVVMEAIFYTRNY
jgi:hypothetical protein